MDTTNNMQTPNNLSYQIFSILETKFLFGYGNDLQHKVYIDQKQETERMTTGRNQRGKVCVLSIDGGGMRSILSGKALAYLENALKVKSGNADARIADYFDVAAGTGVGGIFTAMLFATEDQSRPLYDADDTWKLLVEKGNKFYPSGAGNAGSSCGTGGVFKKVFKGGGGGGGIGGATLRLEAAMKEAFFDSKVGKSLTLKDTLKPVLIPCYDLTSAAPFLFSRADAVESDSYDFRLWEVCRATSADPAVFEPVLMRSVNGSTTCMAVDGGLAMSNPTAAAITHVLHNKQEFPMVQGVEDILVLSLGSGLLLEGSFDYQQVKSWKVKEWIRPVARISSDSSADLVDHAVGMAFGQSRSSNYVRIQANGSSFAGCGVNVDSDSSQKNVKMLIKIADEMLKQRYVESVLFNGKRIGDESNFEKLDWFAGELVKEHHRRSCQVAPTVALKQATPRAPKINS